MVPEEERRERGLEKIFEEIIAENFPHMGKEIVNQVQEAQSSRKCRFLTKIRCKWNTLAENATEHSEEATYMQKLE